MTGPDPYKNVSTTGSGQRESHKSTSLVVDSKSRTTCGECSKSVGTSSLAFLIHRRPTCRTAVAGHEPVVTCEVLY